MAEILKKEKNVVYFNIVLPAKDIAESEMSVYKKNKGYFNIPGFRKGKAPKKIIENMYGKDIFFEDAINELLPQAYDKAVEELELEVIDQPNVNIEEFTHGEDVTVSIDVQVKPDIKVKKYKGLEINKLSDEVTDELIDKTIENERTKNARRINVDERPAKEGDIVTIDFVGTTDGEEFEGGTGNDQELELGSGTFIPGFEEQIVGKNVGEEFDVEVTFPEDYHENLAGKDATFHVNLKSISYEELPELDDEFIKDISEFDTVDEYREDVKKNLKDQVVASNKAARQEDVLMALVDEVEVEVPEVMIDHEVEQKVKEVEYNLQSQGLELDMYLNMLGSSLEKFKEDLREGAEDKVKMTLGVEEVIRQEDIEVSDDEIKEEAGKIVDQYFGDDPEKRDDMIDIMLNRDKDRIVASLKEQKAIDLLLSEAKEVEKKDSEETKENKQETEEDTEEVEE
ncbi:MAG: trigger factor [Tissierellia bacterium]|nr:trigger factor [Tissierellia bacterium]